MQSLNIKYTAGSFHVASNNYHTCPPTTHCYIYANS